jgi:hypothetical protein
MMTRLCIVGDKLVVLKRGIGDDPNWVRLMTSYGEVSCSAPRSSDSLILSSASVGAKPLPIAENLFA